MPAMSCKCGAHNASAAAVKQMTKEQVDALRSRITFCATCRSDAAKGGDA